MPAVIALTRAILIVLTVAFALIGNAAYGQTDAEKNTVQSLKNIALIYVDEEGRTDPLALLATPYAQLNQRSGFDIFAKDAPVFGYTDATVWVRFDYTFSDSSEEKILRLAWPHITSVRFYARTEDGDVRHFHAGFSKPFSDRDLDERDYIFDLPHRPGETISYLVGIKSESALRLPITIETKTHWLAESRFTFGFYSFFYGVFMVMAAYNLFIFFTTRAKEYIYYVLITTNHAIMLACFDGLMFQYVWPDTPELNRLMVLFGNSATGFSFLFSNAFLGLDKHLPTVARINKGLAFFFFSLGILGTLRIVDSLAFIGFMGFIGGATLFVLIGIRAIIARISMAWIYLLSWSTVSAGLITYALGLNGYVPHSPLILEATKIGPLFEMILFSFALAYRINITRQEKKQALEMVSGAQEEVRILSLVESKTGLPNRNQMEDSLNHHMSRHENSCVLFLIQPRQFKAINNTLGFEIGDKVIIEIADRLMLASKWLVGIQPVGLDKDKSLANISMIDGITFCLLFEMSDKYVHTAAKAVKIQEACNGPVSIGHLTLDLEVKLGMATCNRQLDTPTLLRRAKIALAAAKTDDNSYCHYTKRIDPYSETRLDLMRKLKMAIKNDTLELFYQPKLSLQNHLIVGGEALLRWHDGGNLVPTGEFVPMAEASGLMQQLSQWVIEQAFSDYGRLSSRYPGIDISINLSASNLNELDLAGYVSDLLEKYNVEPRHIIFGITETSLFKLSGQVLARIGQLRLLGFRISLDDFGTGYASLTHLRDLPVDEVKIDCSFVTNLESNPTDQAIVAACINLSHHLGMKVTAEGIEDKASMLLLIDMGCDQGQGYYFHHPLPLDSFLALKKNNPYRMIKSGS